jgi:ABC-type protease/lipase transport system fused ATPase/permease subunit
MAGTGKAHLRGEGAVLTVEDLTVEFPVGGGRKVHAVSGISIDLMPGETLGIVGGSRNFAASAPHKWFGSSRWSGSHFIE